MSIKEKLDAIKVEISEKEKNISDLKLDLESLLGKKVLWDLANNKDQEWYVSADRKGTIEIQKENLLDKTLISFIHEYTGYLFYRVSPGVYLTCEDRDSIKLMFGRVCEETGEMIKPDYNLAKEWIRANRLNIHEEEQELTIKAKNYRKFVEELV